MRRLPFLDSLEKHKVFNRTDPLIAWGDVNGFLLRSKADFIPKPLYAFNALTVIGHDPKGILQALATFLQVGPKKSQSLKFGGWAD